jgi:hypothetical protein
MFGAFGPGDDRGPEIFISGFPENVSDATGKLFILRRCRCCAAATAPSARVRRVDAAPAVRAAATHSLKTYHKIAKQNCLLLLY